MAYNKWCIMNSKNMFIYLLRLYILERPNPLGLLILMTHFSYLFPIFGLVYKIIINYIYTTL